MKKDFFSFYSDIVEEMQNLKIDLHRGNFYTKITDRAIFTVSWRKTNDNYVLRADFKAFDEEYQEMIGNFPVTFIDSKENIISSFFSKKGELELQLEPGTYHIRFWELQEKKIDEIYNEIKEKYQKTDSKPDYRRKYAYYNMHALEKAYKKPKDKGYKKEEEGRARSYLKMGTELYSFGYIKDEEKQKKIRKLKKMMEGSEEEFSYKIYKLDEDDKLWEIQ